MKPSCKKLPTEAAVEEAFADMVVAVRETHRPTEPAVKNSQQQHDDTQTHTHTHTQTHRQTQTHTNTHTHTQTHIHATTKKNAFTLTLPISFVQERCV